MSLHFFSGLRISSNLSSTHIERKEVYKSLCRHLYRIGIIVRSRLGMMYNSFIS